MKEASENAKAKGHAVIYSDKILPALSKGKFNINTTEISDDSKKKYAETWKTQWWIVKRSTSERRK